MPGHNLSHMYVLIVKVASCFVPSRPVPLIDRLGDHRGLRNGDMNQKLMDCSDQGDLLMSTDTAGLRLMGGRHSHYSQKLYYFWGSKLNSIPVTWGNLQPIRLGNLGIRM